jgi:lipopolysaccharide transport system ATP-binding protein
MSESAAITVENLSKSYLIGHQFAQRGRYTALRDVIALEARNFSRKALDLVCGKQMVQGDKVEEFWALRDVSFEVKRGEVLGIIGPNGAGKSTLLKILSRITEPTRGRVVLRGRVSSLLEVGSGFHPELTGRENIYLNGAILGMTQRETKTKFDEIVAFAEVERFLDTPVKRYSSGMYVRLAFAVAAHLDPEILIVDEVLAVGDAEFQKKCMGKMQDAAWNHDRTILFVSHNVAAVESMCDSALLLMKGRCVARGDTSVVVQEYFCGISRASATPIVERTDREGSGDVRFASLSLEGPNGLEAQAFQCGTKATFHLRLDNRTTSQLRNVRIALGIENELGQRVASLDTKLVGDDIPTMPPGQGMVRIVVPKMTLTPGRYRVELYATINGAIADRIESAAMFDVEWGDYYGTAPLPQHGEGIFMLDHRFIAGGDHPLHDAGRAGSSMRALRRL